MLQDLLGQGFFRAIWLFVVLADFHHSMHTRTTEFSCFQLLRVGGFFFFGDSLCDCSKVCYFMLPARNVKQSFIIYLISPAHRAKERDSVGVLDAHSKATFKTHDINSGLVPEYIWHFSVQHNFSSSYR